MENITPMNEELYMAETENVTILDGAGSVKPTGQYELAEVVKAMGDAQKPVEAPEIVCIDERPGDDPVRLKTPGGATITGFAAVVLMDGKWNMLKQEQSEAAVDWYQRVVDVQSDAGLKLGGHTDNHASGESSNCGAADKLALMIADAAEHGMSPGWMGLAEKVLGENFDKEIWAARVADAKSITDRNALASWNGGMMLQALRAKDGVIEVLNGDHDEVRDPNNDRHNHWGEGIKINTVTGMSNDRDHAAIPFFQVDVEAVAASIQPLATDEIEAKKLLHAAVLYVESVAYRLTDKQPVVL